MEIFRRQFDSVTIFQNGNIWFYLITYDLPSYRLLTRIKVAGMLLWKRPQIQ